MKLPALKTLATAAAALAFTGTASAWLSATGSGDGAGGANVTMQDLTLAAATPASKLYPAGSAAVATTIVNPNASVAHVGSLVLDTARGDQGYDVDAAHAGCVPKTHLTFTGQSTGWTVPANGSLPVTLANAATLSASAPNACQGATFTIYLKAGV